VARSFDVVVIGAGPAGYIAAIRSAQLGLSTACVEKWRMPEGQYALGGTCLNVGCIPSKALLESSENYERALHKLQAHGVTASGVSFDLKAMLARKDQIVRRMTGGIAGLFKKNQVAWLQGHGRFVSGGTSWKLEVEGERGSEAIEATNVIIATGSRARHLPGVAVDNRIICDNEGALAFDSVPEQLGIIGAGVIGLELGSVWRRLGARVTVVEFLDRILATMDGEVSKQFQRLLAKQGMAFKLSSKVTGVEKAKSGLKVAVEPAAGGASETIEADAVLVAIGRRPHTAGLGLEKIGVKMDARGFIETDHFKTSVSGIWAVGDVIHGPMLAHKAEDDAVACVELIAGKAGHVNYDAVPNVVYTWPEVASVGKTEEDLKKAGIAYKVGKFPFLANSRAKTNHETDGFVKILADAKTDRVLGGHIIGVGAGELIAEIVSVIEFGGASEDIARTSHAHPTRSEAVRQAAMAVEGWTMQA
jgi:dihydrolipoamide dehydrogenase